MVKSISLSNSKNQDLTVQLQESRSHCPTPRIKISLSNSKNQDLAVQLQESRSRCPTPRIKISLSNSKNQDLTKFHKFALVKNNTAPLRNGKIFCTLTKTSRRLPEHKKKKIIALSAKLAIEMHIRRLIDASKKGMKCVFFTYTMFSNLHVP